MWQKQITCIHECYYYALNVLKIDFRSASCCSWLQLITSSDPITKDIFIPVGGRGVGPEASRTKIYSAAVTEPQTVCKKTNKKNYFCDMKEKQTCHLSFSWIAPRAYQRASFPISFTLAVAQRAARLPLHNAGPAKRVLARGAGQLLQLPFCNNITLMYL